MEEVQVRGRPKSESGVGAHNLSIDPAAVELVEQASSRIFDHRGGRGSMTSSDCLRVRVPLGCRYSHLSRRAASGVGPWGFAVVEKGQRLHSLEPR